jgi:hypothetical protein
MPYLQAALGPDPSARELRSAAEPVVRMKHVAQAKETGLPITVDPQSR